MDIKEFYKKLGLRIKELRELQGYTQEKLSEKANLSTDYIGKIETNINNPGLIGLFKLIKALNVSFGEFFKDF